MPPCRGLHSALDVVLGMRTEHGFTAADVGAVVEIGCSRANMQSLGDTDPRTRLAAQMSLPYGIGVALVTGHAGLEEFEDRWINDPEVREAMGRVTMSHDLRLTMITPSPMWRWCWPTAVASRDTCRVGLGDWRNPLTTAQVVEKYESLARRVLDEADVAAVEGRGVRAAGAGEPSASAGESAPRTERGMRFTRGSAGVSPAWTTVGLRRSCSYHGPPARAGRMPALPGALRARTSAQSQR